MVVFSIVLLTPFLVFGGTTGKIVGKVVDKQTGEPLPGANVLLVGTTMGASTDANGEYIIINVPVGTYSLKATYIGYQEVTVTNVEVHVDLTTEINFELPTEAITLKPVTIVAERPLVNKYATNEIHIRTAEEIEKIPVRSYTDVVALQAGVVKIGNTLHVRGGRSEETVYYVDGVYQNDPYDLGKAGEIIQTSIQEISYQAGGFNAEYGFANAGLVNITTKTGGPRFNIAGEALTDEFLSESEKKLGAYSYGWNIYNLAISGPVPYTNKSAKFYGAIERRFLRDRDPRSGFYPTMVLDGAKYMPAPPDSFWTASQWQDSLRASGAELKLQGGPRPGNSSEQWHWNGNLLLDYKTLKFKIGGNSSREKGRSYTHDYSLLNAWRMPKFKNFTDSYYVKAIYAPTANVFGTATLAWFRTGEERGDYVLFDDIENYGDKTDVNGDSVMIPYISSNGGAVPRLDDFARFFAPGEPYGTYRKSKHEHITLKVDMTYQLGRIHELKTGFEWRRNTIRYYSIGARRLAGNMQGYTLEELRDPEIRDLIYRASYANNIGYDLTGQKEVDTGLYGAKHPIVAGFYIQDRMAFRDLILNVGLRYDYFNPNMKRFEDPTWIKFSGGMIDTKQLKPSKVYKDLNPRLGLSFPVTDRTVFHAMYGKFTQQPELNRLLVSYVRFTNDLLAGNMTSSGNPNLKPQRTTAYEVGFRQQIGDNLAFDITAYYKELRDYVKLVNIFPNPNAEHGTYAMYVNGDYGTVKGLSFSVDLRRTNRVAASASYTLQYAGATGSTADTEFRIAWTGSNTITYVSPTDYDQRHTGNVNVDIRTNPTDGPEIMGVHPFGNMGLNILFRFGSGVAYTHCDVASAVWPGMWWPHPTEPLNSSTRPWTSCLDLRLDKSITVGTIKITPYLWIINALDSKIVRSVYRGTGLPNDDGWLGTLEGQVWARNNPEGVAFYKARVDSPGNYGPPRQYRLGIRFTLR